MNNALNGKETEKEARPTDKAVWVPPRVVHLIDIGKNTQTTTPTPGTDGIPGYGPLPGPGS